MSELSSKVCTACSGDEPALKATDALEHMKELDDDWDMEENHHILRSFDFPDFKSGLEFVNEIGELAEEQGHHPNIRLEWGEVLVKLYTHKIDGLHENDFIMAAKIDEIYEDFSE
jgi:4a-hydroxytetrahydrobiopterin dehydratase